MINFFFERRKRKKGKTRKWKFKLDSFLWRNFFFKKKNKKKEKEEDEKRKFQTKLDSFLWRNFFFKKKEKEKRKGEKQENSKNLIPSYGEICYGEKREKGWERKKWKMDRSYKIQIRIIESFFKSKFKSNSIHNKFLMKNFFFEKKEKKKGRKSRKFKPNSIPYGEISFSKKKKEKGRKKILTKFDSFLWRNFFFKKERKMRKFKSNSISFYK